MDYDLTQTEQRLIELEQVYGSIGLAGAFVLGILSSIRERWNAGDRSPAICKEIWDVSL